MSDGVNVHDDAPAIIVTVEQEARGPVIVLEDHQSLRGIRSATVDGDGNFTLSMYNGETVNVGNLTTLLGSLPTAGLPGDVLVKSGTGEYEAEWRAPISYLSKLEDDKAPRLGGDLDLNGFTIVNGTIDAGLI